MLVIHNLRRAVAGALLFAASVTLISCAAEKDTRIVSDPNEKDESTIPWNKQEKWETQGQGQLANMMDSRR